MRIQPPQYMTHQPFPILIDCDGVLIDFLTPTLAASGSPLKHDDVTEVQFIELQLTDEERRRVHMACEELDFWRAMRPYPGAVEVVARIRALGYDVVALTSPWDSCEGWEAARLACLDEHFGIGRADFMPIKGSRKHLVRGAALIEDHPGQAAAWRFVNSDRPSFLLSRAYNLDAPFGLMSAFGAPPITRIAQLADVLNYLG